jgi:pyrophosphatase PpaX
VKHFTEDMRELNTAKRAILFDLDGTLVDTTDLILRCFSHCWQTVYGLEHSREALIATFGIPLSEAMRRLTREPTIADLAVNEEMIERLLIEYRSFNIAHHDSLAQPFKDTCRVIEELRARGYLIGVVTSKGRELATRGLKLCSLDGLIDAAVFLEDTSIHKPNPEPILAALEKLNTRADCAAYVGDSCHDMIAGRRAEVRTIAALWGPYPRTELEREHPDHLAESIDSLLEIFI